MTEIGLRKALGLALACLFAVIAIESMAAAQDKSAVYSKLRQLPDLGACPSSGAADPDLKKALSNALAQARSQAKDMLDSVARMKDAGLASAEVLKQLSDSATKLNDALANTDDCAAARAFAQKAPAAPVAAGQSSNPSPSPGGTCDNAAGQRPCLAVPHAGDTQVMGEVAVENNKLDPNAKVKVSIDGVAAGDPVVPKEENGKFTFKKDGLDPLVANAKVQAEQVPAVQGSSGTTGPVVVQKAVGLRDSISISTDVLDFGHQSMQTVSDVKPVTVTNGSKGTLNLQLLASTGETRNYQFSGCQNPLGAGQQCTFNVKFAPYLSSVRERFVAVVPSGATQTFESLRKELNKRETEAAVAEDLWRVEKRCADEKGGKLDSDCPDCLKSETKKEANDSAEAKYAAYLEARNQVFQAEQNLRSQFNVVALKGVPDHWRFPFTRAVVGVDMSAPTSNTVKQSFSVDFDLLAPLKFPRMAKNEDPLENRFWVWLNPRMTSLPQAANFSAVSTINETGTFFDSVSTGKLNDIVSGLDVSGGLEIALVKPRDGIPWWGEYVNTQARLSPSLIFGVGVSTPFSTNSTEVTSTVSQAICDAFKAPTGQQYSDGKGLVCTYTDATGTVQSTPFIAVNPASDPNHGLRSNIDFYTPDRSRFFRRYYTGLRFKTYFFSRDIHSFCKPFERRHGDEGDCAAPYDIFPGIIDLTVGQDEAVTGGHLSGWLFRAEAVYPLPWYQGIHIFGAIYTKLQGNSVGQPYTPYTVQKPAAGVATDLNTFRYGVHPLDRDYFRIGIGVDLIQVFKKAGQPAKNAPQTPVSDTGGNKTGN